MVSAIFSGWDDYGHRNKPCGERMTKIVVNDKGQKVVCIDEIVFSSKRKIDWVGVERFLKQYIGKNYVIDETDEYANSIYSHKIYGTIAKAKANAAQAIPELIEIATNISFQDNSEEKHKTDAKFGWYRCTVRFSIPTCDDKGIRVGCNNYQGRMIIRCGADGKKYLYDIIDIKKET